ncbi:MAG: MOSC domain-containing protein [Methylococcales symbiont of Iophon sp. n. MRB-2018]|nr:MAG: MOSC domain-containing protein [Methylococcales symbiont of Iophon sp. n. MRB-2018]KAF3979344.1 MAG: MOSC domain-containing protein [Methylococcales symbiont of Iophon sp. n. MRB-2018]
MSTIASLWRYPVKSMMGEELRSTKVTEKGIYGDRAFALVDMETGKIVSAKNPRRWANMFSFRSRYDDLGSSNNIRITLPDGTTVNSNDDSANSMLSKALGKEVKFISQVPDNPQLEEYWPDIAELDNRNMVTDENMPKGTFYDLAIIHLLTTSTLNELSRLYPEGRFEARRFRPNIIVNTDQDGFVESGWIGKTVAIGDEVKLKITDHCPRCVMTTLEQGDLPKDTKILRIAAEHNKAHVGVYAEVIKGGTIKCADAVRVMV